VQLRLNPRVGEAASLLVAAGEQQDFPEDAPQVPAEPPVNGAVFSAAGTWPL